MSMESRVWNWQRGQDQLSYSKKYHMEKTVSPIIRILMPFYCFRNYFDNNVNCSCVHGHISVFRVNRNVTGKK